MRQILIVIGIIIINAQYIMGKSTSGDAFLKIDTGARPVGMAGAFCAVADDINACYYNPSGLTQLKTPEFIFTHNDWITDINQEYVAYVYTTENYAVAISATYLYMGDISETIVDPINPDFGKETGKMFNAGDTSFAISYAQKLNSVLSLGLTVKYIQETISDQSATGYAGDAGILYEPNTTINLGLSIHNIGNEITFIESPSPLPTTLRLGAAYQYGPFTLSSQLTKVLLDNNLSMAIGVESWLGGVLGVRIGYAVTTPDNKLGEFKSLPQGLSTGIGAKISNFEIDYAFLPYGDLDDTHRISLSLRFPSTQDKSE